MPSSILDLCSDSALPRARSRVLSLCETLYAESEKNRSHPMLGVMVDLMADRAEAGEGDKQQQLDKAKEVRDVNLID